MATKKTTKKPAKKVSKPAKKPAKKASKKHVPGRHPRAGGRPKKNVLEALQLPSYSPIGEDDLDNVREALPIGSLHTLNDAHIPAHVGRTPVKSILEIEAIFVEDGLVNVIFYEGGGTFVAPAGWLLSRVVRRPAIEQALDLTPADKPPAPAPGAGYLDADVADPEPGLTAADVVADVVADDVEVV